MEFTTSIIDGLAPGVTETRVFEGGKEISVGKLVRDANAMRRMIESSLIQISEDEESLALNQMTQLLAVLVDVPIDQATILLHGWVLGLKEQRCCDCNELIATHDNARWRFVRHIIRCGECASALPSDYTAYEKFYVL
jgi:hypothetical protein